MAYRQTPDSPKKREQDRFNTREDFIRERINRLSDEKQKRIYHELERFGISLKDPSCLFLTLILECDDNMSRLPEMSDDVQTGLRDFKATVYDIQRQGDRIAHLLQRHHHDIQLPLSRAMWATGIAGLVGMVAGAILVSIFLIFTVQAECSAKTGQCEKLLLDP